MLKIAKLCLAGALALCMATPVMADSATATTSGSTTTAADAAPSPTNSKTGPTRPGALIRGAMRNATSSSTSTRTPPPSRPTITIKFRHWLLRDDCAIARPLRKSL